MILFKNRIKIKVLTSFFILLGILFFMGDSGNNLWAASAKRGGIFRIAKKMTVPTLDLHKSNEYFTSLAGIYECLLDTKIDPKTHELTLVPMLAEKVYTQKDGLQLVFELRKGVKFHDGSTFDANVAKWNLDRMRSHPESYTKKLLTNIGSVTIQNDSTIVLNLKKRDASIPYFLSTGKQYGGMISKAFVEKYGEDEMARKGCGTGPFKLKKWIVDEKIILERVDGYWRNGVDGKPLPYLDGLEEHYKPQLELALVDLRSGLLDAVFNPVLRDVPTVIKNPKLEYVKLPPHEAALPCIGFNMKKKGPFANKNLRLAALYALDRAKFAKIMGFGYARVHQYPRIAPGQPGWAPKEWPDYSYNPKKAKDLVKKSKYDGSPIEIYFIAREPDNTLGELIKANWDAIGINTKLKPLERLAWIDKMRHPDQYDVAFWKGNTSLGAFFAQYFTTGKWANFANYSNLEVDALLAKAAETFDQNERAKFNKNALKIIYSDAVFTSAYAAGSSVAKYKYVKGLRQSYQNIMPHEIWLDK